MGVGWDLVVNVGEGLKREVSSYLGDPVADAVTSPIINLPSSPLTESQFWMGWECALVQELDGSWRSSLYQQMHLETDMWQGYDQWALTQHLLEGWRGRLFFPDQRVKRKH